MFEFKARDLRVDDEFTTDDGNSWWVVIAIETEDLQSCSITARCTESLTIEAMPGEECTSIRARDELVIVR